MCFRSVSSPDVIRYLRVIRWRIVQMCVERFTFVSVHESKTSIVALFSSRENV